MNNPFLFFRGMWGLLPPWRFTDTPPTRSSCPCVHLVRFIYTINSCFSYRLPYIINNNAMYLLCILYNLYNNALYCLYCVSFSRYCLTFPLGYSSQVSGSWSLIVRAWRSLILSSVALSTCWAVFANIWGAVSAMP